VAAESGVYSGIRLEGQWLTTRTGMPMPKIIAGRNTLTVKDIVFGRPGIAVRETWQFTVQADRILWRISRRVPNEARLDDAAFPEWDFSSLSTWTGGLLGDGGVVWDKYLETTNATYGAHTGTVTFWNRRQRDCLRIVATPKKDQYGTVRFSHQPNNSLSFDYVASDAELEPRHGLRRFLSDQQDLWAPFKVRMAEASVEFTLQALAYDPVRNRGTFPGLDGESMGELLDTVGRYGVVDTRLMGGKRLAERIRLPA
jgi:hypothetical protein